MFYCAKLLLIGLLTVLVVAAGNAVLAQDGGGEYDPLPLSFDEMNRYDQIAMEPYRSRYDAMSMAEKADVYGKQFEFMRNRKPNFDPAIMSMMESYQEAKAAPSAYKAKQFMYKPATPKRRLPKPRQPPPEAAAAEPRRPANLLEALPGPWEQAPQPEPEPEPEEIVEAEELEPEQPSGPEYPQDGLRMENLRRGWNAIDVMRGSRKR